MTFFYYPNQNARLKKYHDLPIFELTWFTKKMCACCFIFFFKQRPFHENTCRTHLICSIHFLFSKKVNFHHYMITYMMVNVNQFFLFVFRTKRSRKPAIWNSLPVSGWWVSRYGHIPEQCQENPHMYVN